MRIYDYDGRKNLSGAKVRWARLRMGLSQAELAARLQVEGVSIERDSISRMELGMRIIPDYELVALRKVLGVSLEWLLSLSEE
ncbi:MAG TPA: XRE family transcriptional regulator [Clostridiales bacterium]|nr:XRE family transcriptional regulator [Clostridiales bacterium]